MSKNEKIRFIGTQSTYEAREKRFNDAVNLIKPDRVPIVSLAALFFGKYSGLTNAETLYDYDKMAKAWKQSMQRLNWDMSPLHTNIFSGPVMELMETKTFRWAGYNLGDNVGYQYVEREYMMSDEYDELLADPSGFVIHKTMPRMASVLEPLAMLPHLLFLHTATRFLQRCPSLPACLDSRR